MLFLFIAGIVIVIAIYLTICTRFAMIADDKGYSGNAYFWVCFFLGIIGYIMVAALPDQAMYTSIQNLKKEGLQDTDSDSWLCSCGRMNANFISSCSCGTSKRDATK